MTHITTETRSGTGIYEWSTAAESVTWCGRRAFAGNDAGSLCRARVAHSAQRQKDRGRLMATAAVSTNETRLTWVARARCRGEDPDELFVRGAAQRKAAVICRHCPVQLECGADALDNRVEFGVWGGMTERQRRALLRQHPEVTSWAEFFAAQRRRREVSVG